MGLLDSCLSIIQIYSQVTINRNYIVFIQLTGLYSWIFILLELTAKCQHALVMEFQVCNLNGTDRVTYIYFALPLSTVEQKKDLKGGKEVW